MAVIRGWAGCNGLANLYQLRLVHVESSSGSDIDDCHSQSLEEFQWDSWANADANRKLLLTRIELGRYNNKINAEKDKLEERKRAIEKLANEVNHAKADKYKSIETRDSLDPEKAKIRAIENQLKEDEARKAKLVSGIKTILMRKDEYLQHVIGRIQQRSDGRKDNMTDVIDVAELDGWGIQGIKDPAVDFDFIALAFRIQSNLIRPLPKTPPKIEIKQPAGGEPKPHRWMQSLKDFISNHVHGAPNGSNVKVALIDDGIDVNKGDLGEKVKGGWPKEKPTSSWGPFYQSTGGHGTAMARLIATACPHVDLYVAKLKTFNRGVPKSENRVPSSAGDIAWESTAEEVTKAIEWARKQQVRIISMSWSFVAKNMSLSQIRQLNEEIDGAIRDGIIMYCAESDQGMHGSTKQLYPAKANTSIKVVGSAAEDGFSSPFVNPNTVDYLFPGEQLEEIGNMSGSSAATALAAGFAALIIWCHESQKDPSSRPHEDVLTWGSMDSIFKELQIGLSNTGQQSKGLDNKWVDASRLLDARTPESVAEFAQREVDRIRSG